ncbi:hypothetical protein GOODEAATRI_000012 [Goodea atripinnis]|uniref:Uncharacterized protein n=1 Tax=Goodea atripinnis TaxID=208336 RepID=A0ABV0NRQ0_9TELE
MTTGLHALINQNQKNDEACYTESRIGHPSGVLASGELHLGLSSGEHLRVAEINCRRVLKEDSRFTLIHPCSNRSLRAHPGLHHVQTSASGHPGETGCHLFLTDIFSDI